MHGILSHAINSIRNFFRAPSLGPGEGAAAEVAAAAAARERLRIASEVSDFRSNSAGDIKPEKILKRFDDVIKRNVPAMK